MDKYLYIENMNIVLIRTNDRAHMEDNNNIYFNFNQWNKHINIRFIHISLYSHQISVMGYGIPVTTR